MTFNVFRIIGNSLLFTLFFLSAGILASDKVKTLEFVNSGKLIKLTQTEIVTRYSSNIGIDFLLSNRLIVISSMSSRRVQRQHTAIVRVQKIAALAKEAIFLVTVNENTLSQVIDTLVLHRKIRYVQPDLAQMKKGYATIASDSVRQTGHTAPKLACNNRCIKPRIAIIDDGFDLKNHEFSDLNVLFSYDVDNRLLDATPKGSADKHGTQVIGIIGAKNDGVGAEGVFPDAEIIAIRQASSWTSDLLLGFTTASLMQADIINISWTLAFLPQPLFELINKIIAAPKAPYIVVSAGNYATDACENNKLTTLDSVLTVGSKKSNGDIARFSNFGKCVDVYAPYGLKSVSQNGYKRFGGTSSSAAFVTGVIAQQVSIGKRPSIEQLKTLLK